MRVVMAIDIRLKESHSDKYTDDFGWDLGKTLLFIFFFSICFVLICSVLALPFRSGALLSVCIVWES